MFKDVGDKRYRTMAIPFNHKVILLALSYVLVFFFGFLAQVQKIATMSLPSVAVPERVKTETFSCLEHDNGWHSVEIYFGKTEHFERKYPQQEWHSQCDQDLVVSSLLGEKTNGYFLDLAANHAVHISNTYALEKKFNWTGLCMEPNPAYWYDLAHRNCQVVGAVVGEIRNDEVLFQKTSDGTLGGIVGEGFDNHDEAGGEVHYTVPLYEILTRFQAPKVMDYLSLDVEGAETLIMRHFPFHEYSFNIMTVERPQDELKALFEKFGYEYIGTVGWFDETVWVRTAIKDTLDFASIEEFLKRKPESPLSSD
jgi:Methyltransferase FkbM domain